jgi:tRNA A37 methylthiotransferase MiaB
VISIVSKADELIAEAVKKVQDAGNNRVKVAGCVPTSNEELIKKKDFSAQSVIEAVNKAGSLDEKLKAYKSSSGYKEKADSGKA